MIPNEVVTYLSKRPYFRTSFGKQRVSGFETQLKSAPHHYYRMFPRIWHKLSWKRSILVRFEILRLFLNTLTAEYMHSSRNMQNSPQHLWTQLSKKRKAFPRFFIAFQNAEFPAKTSNAVIEETKSFFLIFYCVSEMYIKFRTFWEKDQASSLSISEIINSTGSGY